MRPLLRRILSLLTVLVCLTSMLGAGNAATPSDRSTTPWYVDSVHWAVDCGLIDADAAARLTPDRLCTRAEAVDLLWRCSGAPAPASLLEFRDLRPEDPCREAVSWALENGLAAGFARGYFCPDVSWKRADVLYMLWRWADSPEADAACPFTDISRECYYYDAVCWGLQAGVTAGVSAERFSPNRACTLAELLCFLHAASTPGDTRRLVVIDPGHQLHADGEKEPLGPGSNQTKAKTSAGTYGAASGLHEYQLNLTISLALRDELERRGYRVILTRDNHAVTLSNIDRARIANEAQADVMLRIHANGSTNPTIHGAKAVNMTRSSPYNPELYADSRALSEAVLSGFCAATGAKQLPIWDTDTMTGINWSTVPVTILEMGYMSNAAEDLQMADPAYQKKMVQGIADGLDAYFENH